MTKHSVLGLRRGGLFLGWRAKGRDSVRDPPIAISDDVNRNRCLRARTPPPSSVQPRAPQGPNRLVLQYSGQAVSDTPPCSARQGPAGHGVAVGQGGLILQCPCRPPCSLQEHKGPPPYSVKAPTLQCPSAMSPKGRPDALWERSRALPQAHLYCKRMGGAGYASSDDCLRQAHPSRFALRPRWCPRAGTPLHPSARILEIGRAHV